MSRWLLAVMAFGFACLEVRAADPKPLWEVNTQGSEKRPPSVLWVGICPDGKTLVAQVEDSSLEKIKERLIAWDLETRKEKFSLAVGASDGSDFNKRANAFTKRGTVAVAGSSPEEVRLTDGTRAECKDVGRRPISVWSSLEGEDTLWLLDRGFEGYAVARGKAAPLAPGQNKKPDIEQRCGIKLPGDWSDGSVPVLAANSDLTRLVVASRDSRKFALYNIAIDDKLKLTEVTTVPSSHRAAIYTARFGPDGKTVATGGGDSTVCLWDVEKAGKDWKPRATLALGRRTVSSLAFAPGGRTLVAGTWGRGQANLFFINPTAEKVAASYQLDGELMSVAFSPDGKTLVTGNSAGRVQVWDAEALRNP